MIEDDVLTRPTQYKVMERNYTYWVREWVIEEGILIMAYSVQNEDVKEILVLYHESHMCTFFFFHCRELNG